MRSHELIIPYSPIDPLSLPAALDKGNMPQRSVDWDRSDCAGHGMGSLSTSARSFRFPRPPHRCAQPHTRLHLP